MVNKKLRNRPSTSENGARIPLTYYRSAEDGPRSPRPKEGKTSKPKNIRILAFGALDIALIGLVIFIFIYSLVVQPIAKISASSYYYHSADQYQAAAEKQLKSLSSRNKLTINNTEIINQLQQLFPEIESGILELPIISQTPTIHLMISEPSFIITADRDYIVSRGGMVVAYPSSKSRQTLAAVKDLSGYSLKIGQPAVSSASAEFIGDLWEYLKAAKIPVAELSLPPLPMELHLKTSDQNYFVKFNLDGDPALQAGQYLAARANFAQNHTNVAEYLDVRVQGKVFYK